MISFTWNSQDRQIYSDRKTEIAEGSKMNANDQEELKWWKYQETELDTVS